MLSTNVHTLHSASEVCAVVQREHAVRQYRPSYSQSRDGRAASEIQTRDHKKTRFLGLSLRIARKISVAQPSRDHSFKSTHAAQILSLVPSGVHPCRTTTCLTHKAVLDPLDVKTRSQRCVRVQAAITFSVSTTTRLPCSKKKFKQKLVIFGVLVKQNHCLTPKMP